MLRPFLISLFLTAPVAAPADVFMFETPSGNIDCVVGIGEGPSDLTCTLHERGGAVPAPRPAGCAAAWGHVFSLRPQGPAVIECQDPGPNIAAPEVAQYGVTSPDWDGIRCRSTRKGLDCWNRDNHGFFLSRSLQALR